MLVSLSPLAHFKLTMLLVVLGCISVVNTSKAQTELDEPPVYFWVSNQDGGFVNGAPIQTFNDYAVLDAPGAVIDESYSIPGGCGGSWSGCDLITM